MPDSEQNEHLKNLLGFDPTDSTPKSSDIPKPKNERYGWPENWSEIFMNDTSKWINSDAIHRDPKSLLAIYPSELSFANYDTNYKRNADRVYWRYTTEPEDLTFTNPDSAQIRLQHNDLKNFQPAAVLGINVSDFDDYDLSTGQSIPKERNEFVLVQYSDSNTYTPYSTNSMGDNDEGRSYIGITVEREHEGRFGVFQAIGKRSGSFDFNKDGEVIGFRFNINGTRDRSLHLSINKHQNRWFSYSDELSLDEFKKDDKEYVKVIRRDGDEIVDEFVVQKKIDVVEIEALFPDELVRNPQNPNPKLDDNWKKVNVNGLTGFMWTPVANDSLDSLAGIPQPAPDRDSETSSE